MKRTIATFILVAVLSAVVYPLFPESTYTIGNLLQLYFLILAAWKFYSAHLVFPETDVQRKTWFLMAAGMFLWMLAQVLEWYCEAILKLVAYGTVADCFWLLGYLPIWVALVSQAREFHSLIPEKKTSHYIRAGLPLLILFGVVFGTITLPQVLDASQSWFSRILDFCFPFFDFTVLFLAFVLWQAARYQKVPSAPWLLMAIAASITTIGDIILSTITDFESMMYITIDIYYFSTYFVFALAGECAALQARKTIVPERQK